MTGETSLDKLLQTMSPVLGEDEYVFCTFASSAYGDYQNLSPIASFQEAEGLTLIIPKQQAEANRLVYEQRFRCITLQIHSSLEAVGLTAAISTRLTEHNISANVVAGYFHDHIFVPSHQAESALEALDNLCQ